MSISNAMNIGATGLKAAQSALDITSHNVSNVNTPNYRRQEAVFGELSFPDGVKSTPDGAGVEILEIKSVVDIFLEKQLPDALSNKNNADKMNSLVYPLKDILNSDSYNIGNAMQNVFNAFQDVANNPTSIGIRQNAIEVSQQFLDVSKSLNDAMINYKSSIEKQLPLEVDNINSILSNIDNINKSLSIETDSASYTDYNTQLYNLSEKIGLQISDDKKNIYTKDGKALIQNGKKVDNITINDINANSGGSVGAIIKFKDGMLSDAINGLPKVTQTFMSAINEQAIKGFDLNGNIGKNIFNINSVNDANLNIKTPQEIPASSTSTPGILNGDNAQNISRIRDNLFNGQKITDMFNNMKTQLSQQAKNINNLSTTYNNNYNDLTKKIDDVSGVNLDEEAVNLMKYQRWYEANAQVIKTADNMIGTLLNIFE